MAQMKGRSSRPRIAVLIPCYNEELTISEVVREFRVQLPDAQICVFDNNSTDGTVESALAAGAVVSHERRQGKGYVVQSMFRQIDADVYLMVDGDGTYPASKAHELLAPVLSGEADMAVGSRLHGQSRSRFRFRNRLGNKLFRFALNSIFKVNLTDILSGYRAFNRRLVKSIPLFGGGFEIETELTFKALERGYRIVEVPIDLGTRPPGSKSKIRLIRDGMLILNTILALFRDYKPLTFFGGVGLIVMFGGLIPGAIVVFEFLETGLIARLPSAILAVALVIAGMLLIVAGLILHTIARRYQELNYHLELLIDEALRSGSHPSHTTRSIDHLAR